MHAENQEEDLQSQLTAAQKDAQRYRWLRDQLDDESREDSLIELLGDKWSDELDVAIDAAQSGESTLTKGG